MALAIVDKGPLLSIPMVERPILMALLLIAALQDVRYDDHMTHLTPPSIPQVEFMT